MRSEEEIKRKLAELRNQKAITMLNIAEQKPDGEIEINHTEISRLSQIRSLAMALEWVLNEKAG